MQGLPVLDPAVEVNIALSGVGGEVWNNISKFKNLSRHGGLKWALCVVRIYLVRSKGVIQVNFDWDFLRTQIDLLYPRPSLY